VDGYTKEVYEANRVGGTFETTLANIVRFLKIKKEKGRGPFSIVQVMQIGEEEPGIEERQKAFRGRFDNLPLDRFIVRTPHNWAGEYDEFGHGVGDDPAFNFTPCTFLWYAMTIFFDGTVAACPQDFFCKIEIGDASQESIATIWNNKAMRTLRRRMKNRDVNGLSPCNECDILNRKTFMGVPTNYLGTFIKDNLMIKK